MISSRMKASRSGFTLLEMLIVLAFVGLLMTMLGSAIWSLTRINGAAAQTFSDLQSESALADRFRGDLAEAKDAPEFAADFQGSPLCSFQGVDGTVIIYKSSGSTIERVVFGDTDPHSQSFRIRDAERIRFDRRGKLLTLTVDGAKRSRLVVAAAIGGERQ